MMNIFLDWILFALCDMCIILYFYYKIGKCKKFNIIEILISSVILLILGIIAPPPFRQLTMMFGCIYWISFRDKYPIKQVVGLTITLFMFMLVMETIYVLIINMIGITTLNISMDKLLRFIWIIPMRIIETILISKGEVIWAGFGMAKLKNQKMKRQK